VRPVGEVGQRRHDLPVRQTSPHRDPAAGDPLGPRDPGLQERCGRAVRGHRPRGPTRVGWQPDRRVHHVRELERASLVHGQSCREPQRRVVVVLVADGEQDGSRV